MVCKLEPVKHASYYDSTRAQPKYPSGMAEGIRSLKYTLKSFQKLRGGCSQVVMSSNPARWLSFSLHD